MWENIHALILPSKNNNNNNNKNGASDESAATTATTRISTLRNAIYGD